MTLYEINQMAYAEAAAMTEEEIQKKAKELKNFLTKYDSKYYIMVNVDGKYYTVYTYKQGHRIKEMVHEILDVTKTLGILKGIEIEKDMVEFWIQNGETCQMYALFDYSKGVIEV